MKIFRNILNPIRCLAIEQMNFNSMCSAKKIQKHLGYLVENTEAAIEDLNVKGRYWLKAPNNRYLAALRLYQENGQILGFELLSPYVKAKGSPREPG